MLTQSVRRAVIQSAVSGFYRRYLRLTAGIVLAGCLAGCLPSAAAPPLTADPADVSAPVPPVGYRSTVAPYTTLRPTAPTAWSGPRDNIPSAKTDK